MAADNIYEPPNALAREEETLAPYAMRTRDSRGRKHPETAHPYRSPYPRDRDRIVHSTVFRRLMHKTQVLVSQTNDHHRTRLTHTLEVAQISRTIARQLGLNGYGVIAAEAIADVVVLDQNFSVVQTYIGGQLVYGRNTPSRVPV